MWCGTDRVHVPVQGLGCLHGNCCGVKPACSDVGTWIIRCQIAVQRKASKGHRERFFCPPKVEV